MTGEREKKSCDEAREEEREREATATRTYNALFLVAARFKGKRTLLDISIRGEHVASRARERTKEKNKREAERERERKRKTARRNG